MAKAGSTRYSGSSWLTVPPSAGSAHRGWSSPRTSTSATIRAPSARTSVVRSRGTSAGAPATRRSSTPSWRTRVVPGPTMGETRSAARTAERLRVVGQSIIGHDFEEKVAGELAYADDWSLPGMLHGKVVRAQVPCARIASIDASAALALPGVRAVLTASDVPSNEIREEASGLGLEPVAMPVLAADRVRYQGEPV